MSVNEKIYPTSIPTFKTKIKPVMAKNTDFELFVLRFVSRIILKNTSISWKKRDIPQRIVQLFEQKFKKKQFNKLQKKWYGNSNYQLLKVKYKKNMQGVLEENKYNKQKVLVYSGNKQSFTYRLETYSSLNKKEEGVKFIYLSAADSKTGYPDLKQLAKLLNKQSATEVTKLKF